jgi:hypothetical protein
VHYISTVLLLHTRLHRMRTVLLLHTRLHRMRTVLLLHTRLHRMRTVLLLHIGLHRMRAVLLLHIGLHRMRAVLLLHIGLLPTLLPLQACRHERSRRACRAFTGFILGILQPAVHTQINAPVVILSHLLTPVMVAFYHFGLTPATS